MKVEAIIFDLDGTVIEDEDEWGEAFGTVLQKLGVKGVSKYPHVGGIGIDENWPELLNKYKVKTLKTKEELATETKDVYNNLIPRITIKKGFIPFIEGVRGVGIFTALATSSTWDTVEKIFDQLELEKYFDSVTTGEEVSRKKPDPEIFEVAVDKLNSDPGKCIVIEDSEAGVEAGRQAGMKVIGIARSKEHKKTLKKADLIVSDFSEITLEKLYSLRPDTLPLVDRVCKVN